MEPVSDTDPLFVQVTKPTFHHAIFIDKPFAFDNGPVPQRYPGGAVLVTDGKYCWGVASDVFKRNFKKVTEDGVEHDLKDLSEVTSGS